MLNECFGRLTDIVDAAGGEVLSFPGDAALAVWTADSVATNLAELVQQCTLCGLELQSKLDRFQVPDGIKLRLSWRSAPDANGRARRRRRRTVGDGASRGSRRSARGRAAYRSGR